MNSGVQGLVSVKDYFGHKTSFFCDGNGLVGKSLLNGLIWCWTFLLSDCDWKHIHSHGPQRISFEDDQLLVLSTNHLHMAVLRILCFSFSVVG